MGDLTRGGSNVGCRECGVVRGRTNHRYSCAAFQLPSNVIPPSQGASSNAKMTDRVAINHLTSVVQAKKENASTAKH